VGTDEVETPARAPDPTALTRLAAATVAVPLGDRAIPARIGDCELVRVISTGSMATVYEAIQDNPRRTVVVKVMAAGVGGTSGQERLRRESQLLAVLHHDHIAQVYEAGSYRDGEIDRPYFVMEYVPGARTLTQYAEEHHHSTGQRLALFMQVLDAVHHAHQRGIVHRDLKPSNILVNYDGNVKIIDFGVARTTGVDPGLSTSRTEVGELIGTVQYMSPEQAEADPQVIDERSDLYSLGVVLYELLGGRLPYELRGIPLHEALRIIREKPHQPLHEAAPGIDSRLAEIVDHALRKERAWRFQTADEFRRNIGLFLEDRPFTFRNPSFAESLASHSRRWVRRNSGLAMVLAAALAALVAEFAGVPLIYHWTPLNRWWVGLNAGVVKTSGELQVLERVVPVVLGDESKAAMPELSRLAGLGDLARAEAKVTWRALHGRMMKRLVGTGVKAVVFDVMFGDPSEHDDEFVAGVRALREAGIDVVVVNKSQWDLRDGEPWISPVIAPEVSWGAATAQPKRNPMSLDLAIQPVVLRSMSSLVIEAFTAATHPGARPEITFDTRRDLLTIRYYRAADSRGSGRPRQLSEIDTVRVTGWTPVTDNHPGPPAGSRPGDTIATLDFPIPGPALVDEAQRDYAWLLRAPEADLRHALHNRTLMIAYGDDVHATADGRMLNGVWSHAVPLELLLRGRDGLLVERLFWSRALLVLAAGVGLFIAAALAGIRRLAAAAAAAALGIAACALAYREFEFMVNPLPPLLAMVLAAGAVILIRRTAAASST
jgi:hypothetical protein